MEPMIHTGSSLSSQDRPANTEDLAPARVPLAARPSRLAMPAPALHLSLQWVSEPSTANGCKETQQAVPIGRSTSGSGSSAELSANWKPHGAFQGMQNAQSAECKRGLSGDEQRLVYAPNAALQPAQVQHGEGTAQLNSQKCAQ